MNVSCIGFLQVIYMFPRKAKRKAPENQLLERRIFLLKFYPFSGLTCCVFFEGVNITILRGKQWCASLFFPTTNQPEVSSPSFTARWTCDSDHGYIFHPKTAERPDAWQMGAPCQQRRDWPLKRRFTAVSLAFFYNILMNDESTNLPPDPHVPFSGSRVVTRPSYRKPLVKKPSIRPVISCYFYRAGTFLHFLWHLRGDSSKNTSPRGTSLELWKNRDGTKEECLDRPWIPPWYFFWMLWSAGWWASMKLTILHHRKKESRVFESVIFQGSKWVWGSVVGLCGNWGFLGWMILIPISTSIYPELNRLVYLR